MTIAPTADGIPDDHKALFDPVPISWPNPNPPDGAKAMAHPIASIKDARPSRRTPSRPRRLAPAEPAVEHHALYRLYNADGVLLYIGETNNPIERYIEHREDKEWWPEVARHSIKWSTKGRAAVQEMEKAAIRDEWPLHNIAHQPRGDGTHMVPSYVVGKVLEAVKQAVREVIGDATEDQTEDIRDIVFEAFTPRDDEEIRGYGEIGFSFPDAPEAEDLNLDALLDAMGPFRPDIDNSMRVGAPRKRSGKYCDARTSADPRAHRCGGKLRRNGMCPHSERHQEATVLADPLDAVDVA